MESNLKHESHLDKNSFIKNRSKNSKDLIKEVKKNTTKNDKKIRDELKEREIDKMIRDSFPASDPPSTY